jgi:uncharacterized protein (TIGR02147 family)
MMESDHFPSKSPKLIFEYADYRVYLKDWLAMMKMKDSKFTLRTFAERSGFKAHSYIIAVVKGQKSLSLEGIKKIAAAMELNKQESEFFRNLVLMNQAESSVEKQTHAQNLLRSRFYRKLRPLSTPQLKYYSNWYYIPVRELVGIPGFKEDPHWIAKNVCPEITPKEAQRAIEELLILGLIERDANGILHRSENNISTGDEVTSSFVSVYHREMLKMAAESIDNVPRELRDISSLSLSLSTENAAKIKALIQNFRKELLDIAMQDQAPERVYQLGFQLFPLTQKVNKNEDSE